MDSPIAFGGIGEVYDAFAQGKGMEGGLVNFEGAVIRYRMLAAMERCAKNGTGERYL